MRTRICKKCGKAFDVPTGKESYLCEECARNSKINSVLRERTCKICGASFMGYPRSFFCPACSAERKRQQKKNIIAEIQPDQSGAWIFAKRAEIHILSTLAAKDIARNARKRE